MEIGRRMASSRSIGEFLDAQAELGQRAIHAALECGRKISESPSGEFIKDCIVFGA
jgi:hypothetical protein